MYHDRDRSTFDDAAPITTTTTQPRTFDTQLKWELSLALPHAGFGGVVGDILRVLIQLYDGEKGFAWPSEDFIAFMVKKDERTVRHHMPKVLASGLFTKVRGRQHEANHYVLDWTVVDRLVPADRKGFAALCRTYREQKQTGKRTRRKADRQDFPSRPATSAVSDRQDLPAQTGEKLPATSLMDFSHLTTLKGEENARAFAVAPAPAVAPAGLDGLGDEQPQAAPAPKPLTFNEEWDVFVSRFPGETMGTKWRGRFCALRIAGVTLADVLETLDRDIAMTGPDTVSRSMPKFLGDHFGHIGKWHHHDDEEDDFPLPPGCTVIPASWVDDDAPF